MPRRSSHSSSPPAMASRVASSVASPAAGSEWRAITQTRTTPISVSLASA